MRIKAILLLILVLVIVVIVSVPWFEGNIFQRSYLSLIEGLNKQSQTKITVLEYQRGIFSSNVKLSIVPPKQTKFSDQLPSSIIVDQHISHGPYLHDPIQGWIFAKALIKSRVQLGKPLGEIAINTQVTSNHFISHFVIPAIKRSDKNLKISWQGLKGSIDAVLEQNYFSSVTVDITSGLLSSTRTDIGLATTIQPATGHFVMNCDAAGQCQHSLTFSVSNLQSKDPQGLQQISMLNINLSQKNSSPNVISLLGEVTANQINSKHFTFGASNFKFSAANLNENALRQLSEISKQFRENPKLWQNQAEKDMFWKNMIGIIIPSTVIDLQLKTAMASGAINMDGKLFWPTNIPLATTPDDFIHKVSVKLNLRAATALVDEIIDTMARSQAESVAQMQPKIIKRVVVRSPTVPAVVGPLLTPAELEQQLNLLVQQKQIDNKLVLGTRAVLMMNLPASVYASLMDKKVTYKLITPETAAKTKLLYSQAVASIPALLSKILATPVKDEKDFQNIINAFQTEGFIQPAVAKQILDLESQNFSPETFDAAINQLVNNYSVSTTIASLVKSSYKSLAAGGVTDTGPTDQNLPPFIKPPSTVDTYTAIKQNIMASLQALIKKGYVVEDNNDYVVTFDYEAGVLKVNNIVVPTSALMSGMNPQSKKPAQITTVTSTTVPAVPANKPMAQQPMPTRMAIPNIQPSGSMPTRMAIPNTQPSGPISPAPTMQPQTSPPPVQLPPGTLSTPTSSQTVTH